MDPNSQQDISQQEMLIKQQIMEFLASKNLSAGLSIDLSNLNIQVNLAGPEAGKDSKKVGGACKGNQEGQGEPQTAENSNRNKNFLSQSSQEESSFVDSLGVINHSMTQQPKLEHRDSGFSGKIDSREKNQNLRIEQDLDLNSSVGGIGSGEKSKSSRTYKNQNKIEPFCQVETGARFSKKEPENHIRSKDNTSERAKAPEKVPCNPQSLLPAKNLKKTTKSKKSNFRAKQPKFKKSVSKRSTQKQVPHLKPKKSQNDGYTTPKQKQALFDSNGGQLSSINPKSSSSFISVEENFTHTAKVRRKDYQIDLPEIFNTDSKRLSKGLRIKKWDSDNVKSTKNGKDQIEQFKVFSENLTDKLERVGLVKTEENSIGTGSDLQLPEKAEIGQGRALRMTKKTSLAKRLEFAQSLNQATSEPKSHPHNAKKYQKKGFPSIQIHSPSPNPEKQKNNRKGHSAPLEEGFEDSLEHHHPDAAPCGCGDHHNDRNDQNPAKKVSSGDFNVNSSHHLSVDQKFGKFSKNSFSPMKEPLFCKATPKHQPPSKKLKAKNFLMDQIESSSNFLDALDQAAALDSNTYKLGSLDASEFQMGDLDDTQNDMVRFLTKFKFFEIF